MHASKKTYYMTLSAIFAALIYLFTAHIFHIPTPFGYTHFGNALIFLVGTLLPAPYAWASVVIGCGIADLLTAPVWIVPTVIIKGAAVLMMSSKTPKIVCARNLIGVALAYAVNFIGYYLCSGFMYGSWLFSLSRVVTDLVFPLLCVLLFLIVGKIMDQMHFKTKFHL